VKRALGCLVALLLVALFALWRLVSAPPVDPRVPRIEVTAHPPLPQGTVMLATMPTYVPPPIETPPPPIPAGAITAP
jgi:hypothetical protein